MALYAAMIQHLEQGFLSSGNHKVSINNFFRVSGGDINETFKLGTSDGSYFLKLNSSPPADDFFKKEEEALQVLAASCKLRIPRPLFLGKSGIHAFLVMEYLEKSPPGPRFWQDFGAGMAELHKQSTDDFGWKNDNFIGLLRQNNGRQKNWAGFYGQNRIMPLAIKAFDQQKISASEVKLAERLSARLQELIPEEQPSLLHGDLWCGNFMACREGPSIFDPAVYYGHRETDLAMTQLFGGFEKEFYDSYEASFPLQSGWKERIPLFQIYPLLVHLILFGGHYRESVISIIKKFV